MSLHLSVTAVRHLSERGTDLQYGARPMKRLIQNALLNPLATLILQVTCQWFFVCLSVCAGAYQGSFAVQEKIVPGNKILVTVKDEALAHSSIVAQGAITVDSAAAAAVIAAESDHSGDMIGGATMWSVGLTVFISLT
jgi:hypothetical protein